MTNLLGGQKCPPSFYYNKELINTTIGGILIIGPTNRSINKSRAWVYLCHCKTLFIYPIAYVKNGQIKSCGCKFSAQAGLTMIYTRENSTYQSMKSRCLNPKVANYKDYGGRGITICDRWKESFENFLKDMGTRPDGSSIDRIDVNGNYEPGNCRWATAKVQRENQR